METKRTALIQDLEDNYTTYLDDTLGYTWDCWDILTLGQIAAHDEVLERDPAEPFDLGLASDLERWAYCRAARRANAQESFLESVRLILAGDRDHDGLEYPEIYQVAVFVAADQGKLDEAVLLLTQATLLYPEYYAWDRVRAGVAYRQDRETGRDAIRKLAETDDLELIFDLTEDCLQLGELPLAEELAAVLDERSGIEDPIWVDVQSLKRAIAGRKSG